MIIKVLLTVTVFSLLFAMFVGVIAHLNKKSQPQNFYVLMDITAFMFIVAVVTGLCALSIFIVWR